jgi:hypothetical protein
MQVPSADGGGRVGAAGFGRAALSALLLSALVFGCKAKGPAEASREEVTSLLRQEAQSLKATGEALDPALRVKATWTVAELAVTERQGDAERPWAGLIRFHIRAETRDTDGAVQVDELDRRFKYQWSASVRRWLIQPAES